MLYPQTGNMTETFCVSVYIWIASLLLIVSLALGVFNKTEFLNFRVQN